jgi:WD40 repeat protein
MDGAIYIWDTNVRNSPVDALANLELLPTERPAVLALALDPQQRFVVSGGQEGRITMWSMTDRSQLGETHPAHAQPVTDLVFTSSEQLLTVENEINAESERNLLISWALGDGSPEVMTETDLAEASPRQIVSIAISPDGQFVAKGGMGVRLFNATTGEPDGAMLVTEDVVTALAFSEDGRYLAAGGLSGSVNLWALAGNEWQQIASIAAHDDRIMHVAFSSGQAELVTGSRDTTLKRWAISEDSLREIETLTEHDSEVLSVVYSPDGRFIASGNVNGRVVVNDLETRAVYSAVGHRNHVNDLTFSNDSRYVASASRDGSIILWDISENQLRSLGEPLVISGLAAGITSVEFNPDGRVLAAGTERGDLVFWDVDVGYWQVLACRIANRNMTAEEQQQFLPDGSNQNVVCE